MMPQWIGPMSFGFDGLCEPPRMPAPITRELSTPIAPPPSFAPGCGSAMAAVAPASAHQAMPPPKEELPPVPSSSTGTAAAPPPQAPIEAPKQPLLSGLTRIVSEDGCTCVHWAIDCRKLESQDKQAVSPSFVVDFPGLGPKSFKLTVYPKPVSNQRRGAGFKKAKGRGMVALKCEEELHPSVPVLRFRISVGSGDKLQPPRGPVAHDFSKQNCGGLPRDEEEWIFSSSVEDGLFVVSLEVQPTPPVEL
eukprot:NODE_15773_length_1031_cov_4.138274.p1 GENE.NODE_15773_length_1031_cov_4.138274~~NODE_15773_length_1031_cov_4.138274.p1  ORF type:complete len:249 (+),score=45.53 NODE_15773_length_1031_cov_4.138274:128-874(+)